MVLGNQSDYIWNQKLALLKKFAGREGHARPTSGHVEGSVKLGGWVVEQRAERHNLCAERIAALEALPGWSWTVSRDAWDEKYEALCVFAAREGHAQVPQRHVENGTKLGSWVSDQREKRDTLAPQRRVRLEAVAGWSWDPYAEQWERAFNLLEEYARQHRTSRVPYSYKVNGVKLGQWASIQRSEYAKGKLARSRQSRLEGLPGWVWKVT